MFNGENTALDDFNVDDLYSAVKSRRHFSTSTSSTSNTSSSASTTIILTDTDINGQLKSPQPPSASTMTAATKRKTTAKRATTKNKQTKKRCRPSKNTSTATPPLAKVSPSQQNADTDTLPIISQSEDIDEILAESDNLLRAAYEAQSLGRLTAAQSYLYLAHARLVGLGQLSLEHPNDVEYDDDDDASATFHGEVCDGEKNRNVGRAGGTPAGESSPSLPLLLLPAMTIPEANHNNHEIISTTAPHHAMKQENISDSLAHSAQELLYKKSGKGMQYNADVERKQRTRHLGKEDAKSGLKKNGREKKKGSKQGSSFTAHGEITSKLLLLGEESMTEESRVVLPLVIPRTILNCAHLDAQSLVESGGVVGSV
mmetsp:Transcript_31951/g.67183  ORF Transcript_31951/g.67183 Transcript_31951/m.67183 type:complete len:371 (-) Transcript_31951:206-1318(-)|eukprot:CAMPEP_0172318160 /NCGR_PEP_ID=MMETSP1058-20130122/33999_1 /TAXON_ID=83371 /ORGANISM="Detonula confervacea, Strain CCMP 353" /LENGTH=370 /DNA_ID=CAMNT_0013032911 /DNA_START=54 /DNA_END=1166 /DNA_ORIENTATION=+